MTGPLDPIDPTDPYGRLFIYYLQGRIQMERPAGAIAHFLGNWEEAGDTFLFFSGPADAIVGEWIRMNPDAALVDRYEMSYEQWQGGRIEPYSIGAFHVRPPWRKAQGETGHDVIIDPGVVFGAGTHPTTRDCLRALGVVAKHGGADTALDLGTGTGILAVAAARMGCRRVVAVDLNRLAARTARDNIRRNGLDGRVLTVEGSALELIHLKADLVIANIHFDAMMPALKGFDASRVRWMVLSGLLRSQVREVEAFLPALRVRLIQKWEHQNTWFTLLAAVQGNTSLSILSPVDSRDQPEGGTA